MRRTRVLAGTAGGLVIAVVAGTVASATIPNDGNLYTACMLKSVGTIRLIDPSLASSNLMSHCTSLETQMSWNQKGLPGPAGVFNGTLTSPNGAYSISVTDAGIVLRAPGASARLVGNDIVVDAASDLSVASGGNTTLQTGKNLAASIGSDASVAVGKDLAVAAAGDTALRSGTGVFLSSPGPVTVNGAPIP